MSAPEQDDDAILFGYGLFGVISMLLAIMILTVPIARSEPPTVPPTVPPPIPDDPPILPPPCEHPDPQPSHGRDPPCHDE